ncbi:matrix protein [Orthorubulavirus mapueraense]|uniref:Matrix protein n=1 Tax=Orthorubulavirus mapueraense TaxID=3052559 RepID=A5H725_9MONO|nr:matrix protein [Orthorubulavirus mapueraense]ABQ23935.1 matrix protein [Orthorubulavirus mapueraense]
MARHAKIPLGLPDEPEPRTLRAFPLVMTEGPGGKGRLMKQLRISKIQSSNIGDHIITFINTYGFVRRNWTYTQFVSERHTASVQPVVTSCMLPFGCGPDIQHPEALIEHLEHCTIKVRKSASLKEEIYFEVQVLPKIFEPYQIAKQNYMCVSSEKYVKAPGKIVAGVDYLYFPTFISLTYCAEEMKFRVAKPIAQARTSFMRSIHLEVILSFACQEDSPIAKSLAKDKETGRFIASVWIHLCNISKNRPITKEYDDKYFAQKILAMKLTVGLVDMWGPTVIVHAEGKIPKSALLFFNKKGKACHPLAEVAPTVAKHAWSVGCTIIEANAIMQESDLKGLGQMDDIVFRKVSLNPEALSLKSSRWNPFTKQQ